MRVVIRIGGSVIASPVNPELISQYTKLLEKLRQDGIQVVAVVGGGKLAREFITIGNQISLSKTAQDWLAIHVSRLYSLLFLFSLGGNTDRAVPTSIRSAAEALENDEIVIMGGLEPGMTTDAVAATLAKEINAQLLVKATDQNGIYTKDPRKYKNARKLEKLTYRDLSQLFGQASHKAGIHQILDPVAVKILQRVRIKTIVVNGYVPKNVQDAIEGKEVGTTIQE